jgi:hypothetical protein
VLPPTPPADLLPAAEQTELAKQARAFELKLGESIASWETLTATNVLAKTKAGSEPCPFAISPPPKAAADAFIETGANDPRDFTSSDFMGYLAKDEVIPAEALYDYERNLKQVIGQLDNGTATARTKERWAAIREPFTFVVIDREDEPDITDMTSKPIEFKPGRVVGRAYMFSLGDAKLVCTGEIDVKSSVPAAAATYLGGVSSESAASKVLHRELEVRIRQALAANLKAVAP